MEMVNLTLNEVKNKDDIQIFLRRNIGIGCNSNIDIYAIIKNSEEMTLVGNISIENGKLKVSSFTNEETIDCNGKSLKGIYKE